MSTTAAFIRSLLSLRRERRSGVLTVKVEGSGATYVYLDRGTPIFVEDTTDGDTLGRLLHSQGEITHAQYLEVLGKMTDAFVLNEQLRFGEVAVELGYLTEAQVSKALSEQMKRKMLAVLQRTDPVWSFDESVARLEDVGRFPMAIEPLVLEALRWVDDEHKLEIALGPALDKTVRVDPVITPLVVDSFELTAAEEQFLATLDGTSTLRQALTTRAARDVDARAIATALLVTRALQAVGSAPLATPDRPFVPVKVAAVEPPRSVEPPPTSASAARASRPDRAEVSAPPPPTERTKPVVRPVVTRAMQILEALETQRVKAEPTRTPTSAQEAKLMAEQFFQRGIEQLQAGRYTAALQAVEKAVNLLPQSDEYRLVAKWCAIRARGEPAHHIERQELKRIASAAIKKDPNFAFGHAVLGELAMDDGETAQAYRFLLRATKLDPTLLEAQRQLRIAERTLDPKKRKSIRQGQPDD